MTDPQRLFPDRPPAAGAETDRVAESHPDLAPYNGPPTHWYPRSLTIDVQHQLALDNAPRAAWQALAAVLSVIDAKQVGAAKLTRRDVCAVTRMRPNHASRALSWLEQKRYLDRIRVKGWASVYRPGPHLTRTNPGTGTRTNPGTGPVPAEVPLTRRSDVRREAPQQ